MPVWRNSGEIVCTWLPLLSPEADMKQVLTAEEIELFTSHVCPQVATGQGTVKSARAYLKEQ